jgi:phospholipid/cholesterol/gamma-HCH transport system ATP-binding protein
VTISHDMASVRRIADTVAMVHNGVIIWAGSADNMENSGVPEVHQFVHGLSEGPLTREMSPSQKADS